MKKYLFIILVVLSSCSKKIEDKYNKFGLEISLTPWRDEYEIIYK